MALRFMIGTCSCKQFKTDSAHTHHTEHHSRHELCSSTVRAANPMAQNESTRKPLHKIIEPVPGASNRLTVEGSALPKVRRGPLRELRKVCFRECPQGPPLRKVRRGPLRRPFHPPCTQDYDCENVPVALRIRKPGVERQKSEVRSPFLGPFLGPFLDPFLGLALLGPFLGPPLGLVPALIRSLVPSLIPFLGPFPWSLPSSKFPPFRSVPFRSLPSSSAPTFLFCSALGDAYTKSSDAIVCSDGECA